LLIKRISKVKYEILKLRGTRGTKRDQLNMKA